MSSELPEISRKKFQERLKYFIKKTLKSQQAFALELNADQPKLNYWLNQGQSFPFELLAGVFQRGADLNWLISGRGKMLRQISKAEEDELLKFLPPEWKTNWIIMKNLMISYAEERKRNWQGEMEEKFIEQSREEASKSGLPEWKPEIPPEVEPVRKIPLIDPGKQKKDSDRILKIRRKKGVIPIFDINAAAGEANLKAEGPAHQVGELHEPRHARPGTWGVFVRGGSMEPLLHEGDLLVFDAKAAPHDGDLVVCRIHPYNDAYVKLLSTADLEPGAKLALIPLDGSGVNHVTTDKCDGPWPVIDIVRKGDKRIKCE